MALSAIATGLGCVGVGVAAGGIVALVGLGAAGVLMGAGYLGSPTWKIEVVTDAEGLTVRSPGRERFRLLWSEVVKVIAAPSKGTCYLNGGSAARSLLVPGDGAPAPYDIVNRAALVEEILAKVAPEKIERVESLEHVTGGAKPS